MKGSVQLTASVKEEQKTHFYFLVGITDTGIGIDENEQNKLFGMFTKIQDLRVRNPLGVGLGLAICKQLVELMGGQIWVESRYGEGSTFNFTLQLEKTDAAQVKAAHLTQPARPAQPSWRSPVDAVRTWWRRGGWCSIPRHALLRIWLR